MRKNVKTIPTLAGLLLLLTGVAGGVFLVEEGGALRLRAYAQISPQNVTPSNISDSSMTINWTTAEKTKGFIVFGKNKNYLKGATLENIQGEVHSVDLTGLSPSSAYYFKINLKGMEFDNDGAPWRVQTGPVLSQQPSSKVISGALIDSSGGVVQEALVFVSLPGGSILSTKTSENGLWAIPLSPSRSQDLSSYMPVKNGSYLNIFIQAGRAGKTAAFAPFNEGSSLPVMTLGKTYYFKEGALREIDNIPEANVNLPQVLTPSPTIIP